jgi:hypothetical protein
VNEGEVEGKYNLKIIALKWQLVGFWKIRMNFSPLVGQSDSMTHPIIAADFQLGLMEVQVGKLEPLITPAASSSPETSSTHRKIPFRLCKSSQHLCGCFQSADNKNSLVCLKSANTLKKTTEILDRSTFTYLNIHT